MNSSSSFVSVAPIALVLALSASVPAQDTGLTLARDKSAYSLFNPTPRELMREMATDRPDQLESPLTVDAGHFQLEMDIFNYSYDRYNPGRTGTRVETLGIAPINVKAGLLNNVDVQLLIDPYIHVRSHDRAGGGVKHQRGFGDTTVRMKWNLWGNDEGETAMAVMPFVTFPTHQDDLGSDAVEGGLMVPFTADLPGGWGFGVMTEVDVIRDGDDDGYHPEFINVISFGHSIVGDLAGFVEFFSAVSTERDSDWIGAFDTGLTYKLTEDIQLDGGVYIGLTRAAEDWRPFLGLSWRF